MESHSEMGLSWGDSGLTLLCHVNHYYQKPFPEAEKLVLPTNANTVPNGLYHGLLFCWTLLGKHSFAGTQEGKFWYYLMEGLDLNWGQFFQDTSFVCLCVVENAITAWSSSSSGSSELWSQDPFATSVVLPFGVWCSSVASTYTVAGIVLTQQASGLQGNMLSTDSLYSTCSEYIKVPTY